MTSSIVCVSIVIGAAGRRPRGSKRSSFGQSRSTTVLPSTVAPRREAAAELRQSREAMHHHAYNHLGDSDQHDDGSEQDQNGVEHTDMNGADRC